MGELPVHFGPPVEAPNTLSPVDLFAGVRKQSGGVRSCGQMVPLTRDRGLLAEIQDRSLKSVVVVGIKTTKEFIKMIRKKRWGPPQLTVFHPLAHLFISL